jgi:hypothetical protein
MQPFRKNVAIAIDGGGIKGVMITRALAILEDHLGLPVDSIFHLAAGTSTGSIISAGITAGLTAERMFNLYTGLGNSIFKKSLRSRLWPLSRYRYPIQPLAQALEEMLGSGLIGEFWEQEPANDLVITTFDLLENRTRFIKPWKEEYRQWPLYKAVLASCAVPTFFPIVDGRYVDGGVGAYCNPCYLAAYEIVFCLGWHPSETTLISLGAGRAPHSFNPRQANRLWAWQWIEPLIGAFLHSADDQQVHLVNTFFQELDFRRFQVNLNQNIGMDDVTKMTRLTVYGDELGRMILNDQTDTIQEVFPRLAPRIIERAQYPV